MKAALLSQPQVTGLVGAARPKGETSVLEPDAIAQLVERAQSGDAQAFTGLARAFLRPAYTVALAILGRPADAEDTAQESLMRALERIDTCREPERFGGWLLQIVRNQARNAIASRRLRDVPAQAEADVDIGGPSLQASRAEGMRLPLLAALEKLVPIRREVVLLHDLEGWTHPEIASMLDISELMSRQLLFLARRELRTQLDDSPDEVDHGRS